MKRMLNLEYRMTKYCVFSEIMSTGSSIAVTIPAEFPGRHYLNLVTRTLGQLISTDTMLRSPNHN